MGKKAIIFDFFGVFCTPPVTTWFKKNMPGTPANLSALQALCTESDYGRLSRADFYKKLSHMTGKPLSEVAAGIEAETHVNNSLVAYARKLRAAGWRIVCLSNGTREWTLRVITDYRLEDLFEHIVLSGDLGIVKPNPEIYRHTLSLMQLEASQVIFVDDKQANVDAAAALGMRSLLFINTETFMHAFEVLPKHQSGH